MTELGFSSGPCDWQRLWLFKDKSGYPQARVFLGCDRTVCLSRLRGSPLSPGQLAHHLPRITRGLWEESASRLIPLMK